MRGNISTGNVFAAAQYLIRQSLYQEYDIDIDAGWIDAVDNQNSSTTNTSDKPEERQRYTHDFIKITACMHELMLKMIKGCIAFILNGKIIQ
jgi:hypothetical protein